MSASYAVHTPVHHGGAPEPTAAVDHMRSYLGGMKPMSVADQLRLLRAAYPDAPLAARLSACAPVTSVDEDTY